MIQEIVFSTLEPALPWLQLSALVAQAIIVPIAMIIILFKFTEVKKMMNVLAEDMMRKAREDEEVMRTPAQSFIDEAETGISEDISKTKVEDSE